MQLIMPKKLEAITIKIVGKVVKSGDKKPRFHCPVYIWGDPRKNIFQLEITSTMWSSLDSELTNRYELGGDANEELDDDLEILTGKIITITGVSDITRAYKTKDGKLDSPKKFRVEIREDLEEIDKRGEGDDYVRAVKKETYNNLCVRDNMTIVDEYIRKETVREEKRKKRENIAENMKGIEDYL